MVKVLGDGTLCEREISDGADDPSFAWCGLPVSHAGDCGRWIMEGGR
jgi:hypothetical protein